ncbi:MAG: peptidase C39 family protein [Candidatus Aenigmarchaeota archaeon]|nr:peptidase C39 family protein [Candidatus Aenigmarchaeota archaeon]
MRMNIPYFIQPDNTHCFQACIKMALKHFFPEKNFSYEELDRISDKKEGKWSWVSAAFVELKKMGLDVSVYSDFDYTAFSKRGADYIREKFSKEAADKNLEMTDIDSEMKNASKMVKTGIYNNKIFELDDVKNWFEKGYLEILVVNSNILNNKSGFNGHAVVLTGIEDNKFLVHDPSMIYGSANREVKKDIFTNALFYPGKERDAYLIKK